MFDSFTKREHEILVLISQGLTNKEIAERLYLSLGTIKAHNHNIFSKLHVSNRTQALIKAKELGLLPVEDSPRDVAAKGNSLTISNVSSQLTPLIGRKTELTRLTTMLKDDRIRLITILATGGMGKTHLATALAKQQADAYKHGVYFSSLARISDVKHLPMTIINDMGLRFQSSEEPEQQLLNYLQDKQLLLVLDNFEHLLEGVPFLNELLHRSPETRLIVTSRERLNLSTELIFVLGGLDYETGSDFTASQQPDAVQLLIERARLINPDFSPEDHEWVQVSRICKLTQGMPLALILATGWLEMLTLEEIADELSHSIDILESQLRDLPARQRSMRTTITSSWSWLNTEEQVIFAGLSVFRGGFTRDAAQNVTGASLRDLQTLVNRSFVVFNEGRYEIHELLRQFGEEELQRCEQSAAVYKAHSAFYLDLLHQSNDDLKGRHQQAALDRIYTDYDNVQVAWVWAVQHRNYGALEQVVECLCNFSVMRAFLNRVEGLFKQALDAFAPETTEIPHPVWDQIASRHIQTRDRLSLPVELGLLEVLLERARLRDDTHETAYCLWVMGNKHLRAGDYNKLQTCLEESLALWRKLGDEFYVAHILVGMTGEDMSPESSKIALAYLQESVDIRRRLGDRYELSFSLMMMGTRYLHMGEFEKAERYYDECLALQGEKNRSPDFAGIVAMKGSIIFWRGDFEAAAYYAQLGLDFSQDMNYYGDKSACQAVMSFVASMQGDYSQAQILCDQANRDELFDVIAVSVYWGMTLAYCGLGDLVQAQQTFKFFWYIAYINLKSSLFQYLSLPLAAVLAAHNNEPEYATELLALTYAQPSETNGWMQKWPLLDELCQSLKDQLGENSFEAAWARGATSSIDVVSAQLHIHISR